MVTSKTNKKSVPKTSAAQTNKASLRSHARRHYYTYMPNKKHHRVLLWVVFLFITITIAVQMLYPLERALPLARIGGQPVGWQSHDLLASRIADQFAATKLHIQINQATGVDYDLKLAGAEPKTEEMIGRLGEYSFWQRFIPLSLFFQTPSVDTMSVDYSNPILEAFSEQVSQKLTSQPTSARLAIEDGQIIATADKSGSTVSPQAVAAVVRATRLRIGSQTTITIPSSVHDATTTSDDFAQIKSQAEIALARRVVFSIGGVTFEPTRADIATWLIIGSDDKQMPTLGLDAHKLHSYLDNLNSQVGTPAGQTNVNLVDGRNSGGTTGNVGKAIDQDPVVAEVTGWLLQGRGGSLIVTTLVNVEPTIIYNNKYTATEAGLRAYVADAAHDQHANIVVRQIDGQKWSASSAGDLSIPSASTYKLFVALMLFDKMDKGQVEWSDPILDTTVSGCFDRMTIASTNPCPVEWLNRWGRTNVNQFVYDHGFSQGTDFNNPTATHTTANDLTKFMLGLEDSSLVNGAQRDRLLHSLSVHPYRYGIPTGSKGQVWDKVGFLWDYVHDTAIVYHPKGKYVMTIMTKGRSYATIAAITRDIERIMYP